MICAVEYTYDPDRSAELAELRPRHREFLRSLLESGDLITSGPWLDGAPGALLLVRAADADAALELLADDPFQQAGLIAQRTARGWDPVLGVLAS